MAEVTHGELVELQKHGKKKKTALESRTTKVKGFKETKEVAPEAGTNVVGATISIKPRDPSNSAADVVVSAPCVTAINRSLSFMFVCGKQYPRDMVPLPVLELMATEAIQKNWIVEGL